MLVKLPKIHAFVSTLHNDVVWQAIAAKHRKNFIGHGDIDELHDVVQGLDNTPEPSPAAVPVQAMPVEEEGPRDIFSGYKGPDLRSPAFGYGATLWGDIHDLSVISDKKVNVARASIRPLHIEQRGGGKKSRGGKSKKIAPRAIIVADDLGDSIQASVLTELYKRNRHYKTKTITSSQNYNDISKQARLNMDYIIMFKGQSIDRLKKAASEVASFVPEQEFIASYRRATSKPYGFLIIDRVENTLSASG